MSAAVLVPQRTPVVLVVDDVDANGELIEEGEPVAARSGGTR